MNILGEIDYCDKKLDGISKDCLDLLLKMTECDPEKRFNFE